jgi:3,5-epimerase/4-reductase
MKVLLLGNKGWIGSMMSSLLTERKINFITTSIRPNNKTEFEKYLVEEKPTHIMSFIGRTHGSINGKKYTTIDYLEQKGKITENVRDNLFSPLVIALLCKKYNIHYTYLGTGCIFKFNKEHPFGKEENGFTEESTPNFFGSSYSVVKGYTDELMHLFEDCVLNLRIRMPITSKHEPRNFITKITTYEYICSVPNSMTVLEELLPYVIDMAQKNTTGTINPGLISHNEILEMYKEYIDKDFTWKNFSQEEQLKILDADRSNNYLDTTKLETLYPEIKNIKDSIKDVFINWRH